MTIYEDNQATIALAEAPRRTRRSAHYTRQMVASQDVSLEYKRTDEMVADIFTKGLNRNQFEKLGEELGVVCVTSINKPSGRSVKINDGLLSDNFFPSNIINNCVTNLAVALICLLILNGPKRFESSFLEGRVVVTKRELSITKSWSPKVDSSSRMNWLAVVNTSILAAAHSRVPPFNREAI
jgi:hypothetical protein